MLANDCAGPLCVGKLPQVCKEFDGLMSRFEQTEWLRFDRKSDQSARLLSQSIESPCRFNQLCRALFQMVRRMRKSFECQRNGRDAAFDSIRQ
jgi:hypothetical protein